MSSNTVGGDTGVDSGPSNPTKSMRVNDSVDANMESIMWGIGSAVVQMRNDVISQEKGEETIRRVASELRGIIDAAKRKFEKEREEFVKALLENSEQFESYLKSDFATFKASHEKLCYDMFTKFSVQKAKLLVRHEQQRENDKAALAEFEKVCAAKITEVEECLKEMRQDRRYLEILFTNLLASVKHPSNADGNADA